MSTERDTHFAGFAKLLWQELQEIDALFDDPIHQTVIAQRAYDLLIHDRLNSGTIDLQSAGSYLEAAEMVNGIPDLKTWPQDDLE